MQLVIRTADVQNTRLENVLNVDLNIIKLQNVRRHLKRMGNGESKYVLVEEVIVHCRKNTKTAKIKMKYICMHLWHVCLITTNVLVGILVTVCN